VDISIAIKDTPPNNTSQIPIFNNIQIESLLLNLTIIQYCYILETANLYTQNTNFHIRIENQETS